MVCTSAVYTMHARQECVHSKTKCYVSMCVCERERPLRTESCQIVRLAECQKLNGAVKPSASDVNACIACFVNAVECLVFPAQH